MPHAQKNYLLELNQDINWHTPKLLDGLNYESKGEYSERRKSWGMLLGL
jgi:hypothetical protein